MLSHIPLDSISFPKCLSVNEAILRIQQSAFSKQSLPQNVLHSVRMYCFPETSLGFAKGDAYPLRWHIRVFLGMSIHHPVGCLSMAALALGLLVKSIGFCSTSKSQNSEKKQIIAFMVS